MATNIIVWKKQTASIYESINLSKDHRPPVLLEEVFKGELTLFWPGLTGEHHKYIQEKGLRGYGRAEYPILSIKDVLKEEYGIKIVDWFVNPSRLEEEFRHSRWPICIYPYEWKDPESEFSKRPNFLYSYSLDMGGDSKKSILFLKSEHQRFKKHIDHLGNLQLKSLIEDHNLSTNLITGYQYPEIIHTF